MNIIISRSNRGSGGSDGGTSCTFFPKGFTTPYRSTNIANYTPFRRWGLLRSRIDNVSSVRLHLCIHLKILLFIQFISYMFYDVFCWSIRTYVIYCLFYIIFCSCDYYYFYDVYIVILSIFTFDYIVDLTSFFDN